MTTIQLIDSIAKVGLGALIASAAFIVIRCVPGWTEHSEVPRKVPDRVSAEAENSSAAKKDEGEFVRNLVALWVSQNAILWSRLTVISALQTAVYAGWFTLWHGDRYFLSAAVAIVGSALAWSVYALVDNDLKWKADFSDKLRRADARLLPEGIRCVQGWKVMRGIILGFFASNVALAALSLMFWITYVIHDIPGKTLF